MRGLFAYADEKFVKAKKRLAGEKQQRLRTYKFERNEFLRGERVYDRNALPIIFKATPDTLLNLCINVVDALPLPTPHKWNTVDVCKWIRGYGYPHYMTTFRSNFITGRKLLLLDASALSAMNIKNFADIKHIAYGIRQLFLYEMTKYISSISLPPEYYYELYKLFQTKSGPKYQDTRRSELWRQMNLLRGKSVNYSHWELLERWMAHKRGETDLFGDAGRYRLYKCKPVLPKDRDATVRPTPCHCMPPCSCFWTEKHKALPTVFSLLKQERKPDQTASKAHCRYCVPPCTCHWPPHFFEFDRVLTCLKPTKYGMRRASRFEEERIQFRPILFNTD
ncbi:uncharacterized protein LOC101450614 [Ceratitis capitata]|nr:uncharacterized protein LOC101450614 [Ceratitis capitata]